MKWITCERKKKLWRSCVPWFVLWLYVYTYGEGMARWADCVYLYSYGKRTTRMCCQVGKEIISFWVSVHVFISKLKSVHDCIQIARPSHPFHPIRIPHSPQEKAKDRLANASKHRTYSHNIKTIVLLLIRQSTYISNGDIPLTYFTAIWIVTVDGRLFP